MISLVKGRANPTCPRFVPLYFNNQNIIAYMITITHGRFWTEVPTMLQVPE